MVGGAVRNALLGEPVGEVDIATTAVPQEVVRRAEAAGHRTVPTGIAHGTVTVLVNGHPFEVTTLRRDIETDGRHATVAFGRDWQADAQRRDFTINALSVSADGTVHDYTGGREDLAARRVRFIGDPDRRIAEDYLRILRFFRFHAAYGEGPPDPGGLAACVRGRAGIDFLSRERIRMEVLKLLVARRAAETVPVMSDTGLLVRVLGGVPELASFARLTELEAALGLAPDATRRLGALGVRVSEDAIRLWERLRLSNAMHDRLAFMVMDWRHVTPTGGQPARALLYRLGAERFTDRVLLSWSRSGAGPDDARWRDVLTLPQRWTPSAFPLKADDFLRRGVAKGPALGVALRDAEAEWIAQDFPADTSAIAGAAAARAKA